MSSKATRTTGIEWTDQTWNPFVGCSIKSAGCKNCYAMSLADRLDKMGQSIYSGLTRRIGGRAVWTGEIRLNPNTLAKPASVRAPTIFFVNSMSDFFHPGASPEMRVLAMDVMRDNPRHQFQILTKRPELVAPWIQDYYPDLPANVWLGATVENATVVERIEHVRRFPARIKFLSIEPLIGPLGPVNLSGIDWVISGGESGPGARPMEPDWVREVHALTREYRVAHFFKQWGVASNNPIYRAAPVGLGNAWVRERDPIGKGGSLLDGVSWKEMPGGFEVSEYGTEEQKDFSDVLFKA